MEATFKGVGKVAICWVMLVLFSACQIASLTISASEREPIDCLLSLMNQRLEVAGQVAQAKWNSGAAIDDPVREHKILDDIAAMLVTQPQTDQLFMLRFFQAQFDAGKNIQHRMHEQWRQEQHPRFDHPPDLAHDIRPVLDRLTPQLIDALGKVQPLLERRGVRDYIEQRAAQMLALEQDPSVRKEALRVLLSPP